MSFQPSGFFVRVWIVAVRTFAIIVAGALVLAYCVDRSVGATPDDSVRAAVKQYGVVICAECDESDVKRLGVTPFLTSNFVLMRIDGDWAFFYSPIMSRVYGDFTAVSDFLLAVRISTMRGEPRKLAHLGDYGDYFMRIGTMKFGHGDGFSSPIYVYEVVR